MTRVLLVDDDDLMRAGLRMIIEQTDDITVAAEASDGAEALELARAGGIDIVLMDIRMPGMDGIEATTYITALPNGPAVIILTTFEVADYVFDGLQAGASGFLLKRTPPEQLLDGIRVVAEGEGLLSPSVTRQVIEQFSSTTRRDVDHPGIESLTEREREVLVAIAKGWSNSEISEQLFIAENTVKTHVKRVLSKLQARDRVQAVVMAYEAGLMG